MSVPRKKKKEKKEEPKISLVVNVDDLEPEEEELFKKYVLEEDALDSLPDQVRILLHKHLSRVQGILENCDKEKIGRIDGPEFTKALRVMGLATAPENIACVFTSFGPD